MMMMMMKVFTNTRKLPFHLQLLVLYIFVTCCVNSCFVGGMKMKECKDNERDALLMIKKDVVDGYDLLSSWGGSGTNCCKWRGISCNNKTGHITALDLQVASFDISQALGGRISPSLVELQHLTYLDLSYNNFGGAHIPDFIGSLTKLTYLDLSFAQFGGRIPYQLGNLSSLRFLGLQNTNGHLSSENLSWLSNLSSLAYLNMSLVNLEKALDWPIHTIHMHPSMIDLRLSGCSLVSSLTNIPAYDPHRRLSYLENLDLSHNNLTSTVYPWLFSIAGNSLVDLELSGNILAAPIPDAFENMTSLEHLHLSQSLVVGGIPKSLGNLPHLKTLNLYSNNLTGNLPEIVRNLSGPAMNALEMLSLGQNQIFGDVPDITIFSSLKQVQLAYNNLSGSLPIRFKNPSKLEILDLTYNQIMGSIPDLSVFPFLRELRLARNKISGNFPPNIDQLSKLEYLDTNNNLINGSLPENIGQLTKLTYLDVSSNKLQGRISKSHLSNLTQLTLLDLSNNPLTLDFSSEWRPPPELSTIKLQSCKLGPYFPDWLRTLNNLAYLDISDSGVSDVIPSSFWDSCYNVWYLNLSYNHINGSLPRNLSSKIPFIQIIDLSSNNLDGQIPIFVPTIITIDLSKNMFAGSINALCKIIGGPLTFLDISNNLLSGTLPDCWRQEKNELVILNLANNRFHGKIPSSMGSLKALESLHLNGNFLNGTLPSSLQNCTLLKVINFGENKLSGNVPAWIGEKLSGLIILRLRSNNFSGRISVLICYLSELRILDMALNNIVGAIPGCFNNFTAMSQRGGDLDKRIAYEYDGYITTVYGTGQENTYVDNAMVLWKGTQSEYRNILGLLKNIDLSCNNLTGEIPSEITTLSELILLNLSSNSLTGAIPRYIGRLTRLDSLDLSTNKLFGEIPISMASLSNLGTLNLSNNNLTGKIPLGSPLQSREASAFFGNPGLCGSPLNKLCPGDEKHISGPPSGQDGDDNELPIFNRWLYLSITIGFIVGFWGVCGTLVLHTSWRNAYFQFFDNLKDWFYIRILVKSTRWMRKF